MCKTFSSVTRNESVILKKITHSSKFRFIGIYQDNIEKWLSKDYVIREITGFFFKLWPDLPSPHKNKKKMYPFYITSYKKDTFFFIFVLPKKAWNRENINRLLIMVQVQLQSIIGSMSLSNWLIVIDIN